ncbi:hypothetical protein WDU94_010083, partial [Cyamophila willieti]
IILEAIVPISNTELDIRRTVYRTAHPERRLPFNIRIPFLDESVSWVYQLLFACQLYVLMIYYSAISPLILGFVLANNVLLVLCLYQLVASSTTLSPLRYFKFLAILSGMMIEFFAICNSSEVTDNASGMVVNAIKTSHWDKCTNETKRNLIILLRRVQRPNHLKFNNGMIVLSRLLFLKVVRVAYTFVNFIRSTSLGK